MQTYVRCLRLLLSMKELQSSLSCASLGWAEIDEKSSLAKERLRLGGMVSVYKYLQRGEYM